VYVKVGSFLEWISTVMKLSDEDDEQDEASV
jgi:hypothetical protein